MCILCVMMMSYNCKTFSHLYDLSKSLLQLFLLLSFTVILTNRSVSIFCYSIFLFALFLLLFFKFFAFRLFKKSFPYYSNYTSTSCNTCNIMISIDLWRTRIGQHIHRYYPNISGHSFVSIWQLVTDIAFSTILACVISILLIIGGIEKNPGPIIPTHEIRG